MKAPPASSAYVENHSREKGRSFSSEKAMLNVFDEVAKIAPVGFAFHDLCHALAWRFSNFSRRLLAYLQ
jgi:hypothetical protein